MTRCRFIPFLLLLGLLMNAQFAVAKPHQAIDSVDALDYQIQLCLEFLSEGKIAEARLLARQIAWRFPNFALGQLISAELESASALKQVSIADDSPPSPPVDELLQEAKKRLKAKKRSIRTKDVKRANSLIPGDLIQVGSHPSHLVVVDLKTSVLKQFSTRNNQATLIREHYIGSGQAGFGKRLEGDLKTPLGIYHITGFRGDDSLPDLYGAGALMLDYPNTRDRYLGRTGYGIWLHGVPASQRSRPPYSSEGCVTMSNEHLTRLSRELDPSRTSVILTQDSKPLDDATRSELQSQLRRMFSSYQLAWLNGDDNQLNQLYLRPKILNQRLASGNNGLTRATKPSAKPDSSQERFRKYQFKKAFSRIRVEDISIIRNPDIQDEQSATSAAPDVVISANFGTNLEHQLTIFWQKSPNGQWLVLADEFENIQL